MQNQAGSGWQGELIAFAAGTRAGLVEQIRNFVGQLADGQETLAELAAARARDIRMSEGGHRLAILADTREECAERAAKALETLNDGKRTRFNVANRLLYEVGEEAGKLALLYPGFGAYHPSLVADLYRAFVGVRWWIDGLDEASRRTIFDNPVLFGSIGPEGANRAHGAGFADTMGAVLAGNLAMHQVLTRTLGVRPDAMVGHSYGENAMLIASGLAAGYRFATDLVQHITHAMDRAVRREVQETRDGMMLAIPGPVYASLGLEAGPAIHLALDNCPQQVVVYGPTALMEALAAQIQAQGAPAFRLPALEQPVHTPLFPVSREELRPIYTGLSPVGAMPAIYSCTTMAPLPADLEEMREQLVAQWHKPVRFRETIERMYADGIRTFVEVGPGGRLTGFVRDTLVRGTGQGAALLAVASNIENGETLFQLHACVAQLFVRGHSLNLQALTADRRPASGQPRPERKAAATVEPVGPTLDGAALTGRLGSYASRHRQQELLSLTLELVAEILGMTDATEIDAEQGFFDQGMGSLQAIELVTRLEGAVGQSLAKTMAFDYPTPTKLARQLATLLYGGEEAPGEGRAPAHTRGQEIAIVGMGCRFPGGADSPEAFWSLLRDGRHAISDVPAERWPSGVEMWLTSAEELARVRQGGFLADIAGFDSAFFGIAPLEAETMDPQQRLLLEVTWEALERAAISPRTLAGTQTGVFVGISHEDYANRLAPAERLAISGYLATGNAHSTAAGRIAFVLGVNGPCMAVDTACSSSLVAVHLACQSLRRGECDLALAAGVNLLVSLESSVFLSKAGALSVDGRCKTFDASANGYVRGEGCGVVVLKRLADAEAAGDPILAIVRGSAVNHDGRTSGLTVPSGPAQQSVVRQALADARVRPAEVAFVECHGTATSLGDPIEVQALGQVFAEGGPREAPLMLASLKSNIGHLEAAAGIAGVIKAVLQLQNRQLAPSLHLAQLNPKVDWARLPVRVCTELTMWDEAPGAVAQRVGGVSSFGISGTNAHVVLQAAPSSKQAAPAAGRDPEPRAEIFALSARSATALDELTARTVRILAQQEDAALAELGAACTLGRNHFEERRAVVAETVHGLAEELRELPSARQATAGRVNGNARRPKLVFLCSGQGSQYAGMGRRLMACEPVFRAVMEQCDAGLRPYMQRSLIELIDPAEEISAIDQTIHTQPALFAIEYALARLWQSWGIEPDLLLGHSIGEYVAACLAGVFSLEDALRLVAARGRLMQSLPAGGAMLAVMADAGQVADVLATYRDAHGPIDLSVAAVNGPASTVLSGALSEIERAQASMLAAGVRATRLTVSHAFHSALMDPILETFGEVAAAVRYAAPQIPVISNRTGRCVDAQCAEGELVTPDYWVRHLREPVQFGPGMRTLLDKGCNVFLEIGPKPVLLGMGKQCTDEPSLMWLASLQPPKHDERQMLESLAALYMRGVDVDWRSYQGRVQEGHGGVRRSTMLPTYPFQRERYWVGGSAGVAAGTIDAAAHAPAIGPATAHSLLGSKIELPAANGQVRFGRRLSPSEVSVLTTCRQLAGPVPADSAAVETLHTSVFPLAALLTMIGEAGHGRFGGAPVQAREFELHQVLFLKQEDVLALHTVLTQVEAGHDRCEIFGRYEQTAATGGGAWALLATALIAASDAARQPPVCGERAADLSEVEPAAFYSTSSRLGYEYGKPFRVLRQLQVGTQEAWSCAQIADEQAMAGTPGLAPVVLVDGALQTMGALLFQPDGAGMQIVKRIAEIRFERPFGLGTPADGLTVHVTLAHAPASGEDAHSLWIDLCERPSGSRVMRIDGITLAGVAEVMGAGETVGRGVLPESLQALRDADPSLHRPLVTRRIRKLMANAAGIVRERAIDEECPFSQLGIDSLGALRLRNGVQSDYGVDIALARYVGELGVASLVTMILEQVNLAPAANGVQPGVAADGPAGQEWNVAPLSYGQRALWFLWKLAPASQAYHVSLPLQFQARESGTASEAALRWRAACSALVARHAMLRTIFPLCNGQPYQQVLPATGGAEEIKAQPLVWREVDAAGWSHAELAEEMAAAHGVPFDLEHEPPIRCVWFGAHESGHTLLLTMHHIICDGWSLEIIRHELELLYAQAATEERPTAVLADRLPALTTTYQEYVRRQNDLLAGASGEQLWSFWREQLAGPLPRLDLPLDFGRPAVQRYAGASCPIDLPDSLFVRLRSLAQAESGTVFEVVLAAFLALLYRLTGQTDLIVGVPNTGRSRAELAPLVGYFVNPVVVRSTVHEGQTFRQWLREVGQRARQAAEHAEFPFPLLVQRVQPERSADRSPIFDVTINYLVRRNAPSTTGAPLQVIDIAQADGKFDLTLTMMEEEGRLRGAFGYNCELFESATIAAWSTYLAALLEHVVTDPDCGIESIVLASHAAATDSGRVSVPAPAAALSGPRRPIDPSHLLHRCFSEQARCSPDAPAVADETLTLTYGELETASEALAAALRRLGAGADQRVGVCTGRSVNFCVAMLAVLKAGAAYVPLDPSHPSQLLSYMMEHAGIVALLTQRSLLSQVPHPLCPVLCIEEEQTALQPERSEQAPTTVHLNDLAYVMYTSGSTGRPKAVAIEHAAVANYTQSMICDLSIDAPYNFLLASTFSADLGNTVIFPALCTGGCLHILPEAARLDPKAFADYVRDRAIDYLKIVPSHLAALLGDNLDARAPDTVALPRRAVVLGGEGAAPAWVARLQRMAPECRFYNHYGPTETTIGVLTHAVDTTRPVTTTATLPLSRAVANCEIYVLDANGQPAPLGAVGEVFVGGACLARGYLGEAARAGAGFVHIAGSAPGTTQPVYRTGDLARQRANGSIEILGRRDRQVKLRGYRIELAQIENTLREVPGVTQAVVVPDREGMQATALHAFVVVGAAPEHMADDWSQWVQHANRHLAAHLPRYMLPATITRVEQIPLNANGKMDVHALRKQQESIAAPHPNLRPRDEVELELQRIWCEVLERSQVGIAEQFFDLGGHSLLAVRLLARVEEMCGVRIPLATLLTHPTIESLAQVVRQQQSAGPRRATRAVCVPFARVRTGRPIVLLPGAGGSVMYFAELAQRLSVGRDGRAQAVWGLQGLGIDADEEIPANIEQMAAHYVRALRSEVRASGPYALIGHSFGGLVAYEMARQLLAEAGAQERPVALVCVIDNAAPQPGALAAYADYDHGDWLVHIATRIGKLNGVELPLTRAELAGRNPAAQNAVLVDRLIAHRLLPAEVTAGYFGRFIDVYRANARAAALYRPEGAMPAIDLELVRATEEDAMLGEVRRRGDPTWGWAQFTTGRVRSVDVPGTHLSMFGEPQVNELARALDLMIAEAQW